MLISKRLGSMFMLCRKWIEAQPINSIHSFSQTKKIDRLTRETKTGNRTEATGLTKSEQKMCDPIDFFRTQNTLGSNTSEYLYSKPALNSKLTSSFELAFKPQNTTLPWDFCVPWQLFSARNLCRAMTKMFQ